jgi:hypothetical protein
LKILRGISLIIIVSIGILLVLTVISQIFAFIKFGKDLRNKEIKRKKGYKILRIIWFIVDVLAIITIIVFIYTSIKAAIIVKGYENQAYGWLPFIVFVYGVIPTNLVGLFLRVIYLENMAEKQLIN